MSHTSVIKSLQIKSKAALQKTVESLNAEGINCELIENAYPRMFYERQKEKCDLVIKLNDSEFDLGFQLQENGEYNIVCDLWSNTLSSKLGVDKKYISPENTEHQQKLGKFIQEYGVNAALIEAQNMGYSNVNVVQNEETGYKEVEIYLD